MRIYLIRHGEPDYVTDTLTAAGRREAELLSARMGAYHIRDFFTSPLGRAKETAAYTLRAQGREAETLDWLAEFRARFPDPETGRPRIAWDLPTRVWAGMPELLDPENWADAPLFQGGDVRKIWDETRAGVDRLMARYGFRREGAVWRSRENSRDAIALFCHFGISMAVLARLINVSPVLLWQRTLTLTSSLTEVVTEERKSGEVSFRVIRLGDVTHLEAAGVARSTAGMFPECYTGVDSTDQKINGQASWEL